MGMYISNAFRNYEISKEEYNYLLPIYGKCAKDNGMRNEAFIIERNDKYFFCGTEMDYKEMKERCEYL